MALQQISSPGGSWAGFLAAGNPLLYKFQRKDYTTPVTNISSGKIQVLIKGNLTAIFLPNIICWFKTDDSIYSQQVSVFTATYDGIGTTAVVFNESATTGAGSGWINLMSRTLYKVSVRIFDNSTNLDLFGFDFDFYPSKSGLVKADITNAIQSLISPEIPINPIVPNQWFEDNSRKDFYIKYTEVWTGSANTQFNDYVNVKKAIYATNQIGQSDNKIARGQYFGNPYSIFKESLNVLTFDKAYGTTLIYLQITANNISYYLPMDTVYFKIKTVFWKAFQNLFVAQTSNSQQPWAAISPTQWVSTVAIGQQSEYAAVIVKASNAPFDLYYELAGELSIASNCNLSIRCYDQSNTLLTTYTVPVVLSGGSVTNLVKNYQTINVGGVIGHIELAITNVTVGGNNFYLKTSIDLKGTAQIELRADIGVITGTTKTFVNRAGGDPVFTLTNSNIIEPMDNQFNLVWRNHFGGFSNFVFPFSQEYYYTFSKNKAVQYLLYAESVGIDQLGLLQDLNTNGEVYVPVYDELSLAANSTSKRIGAQVYKLDQNGNLTGVLVIPSAPKFRTSAIKNKFQVTVEMPEVYRLPSAFSGSSGGGIFDSTFDDTFQ